ncbi:uncharacterized protein PFL1_03224 [Pseudozyma flocculosa PF-1]|uniref:Sodium/calcium exchanger membrane region domain-containing protein n=1 Tax=Pseudozyma flocculosa PF-1 TaxID=1277687 RepID=A0A061HAH3_9BASI|nr:uncharacterized protein PFL1_03224 [Pseudozyma flocculosa PF-1]EPQ29469.1 hypothetical protein PFL1_03224 [Pseudozyma flocculosa PF-1]
MAAAQSSQPPSPASGIGYPAAVFGAALILLERSADQFIDQVAHLARVTSVSPSLIAILTAGAEWEELAVVVAALGHGASTLAIGNVFGSSISNILGAFSLGLLASPQRVRFDYSAKRFAAIQLAITSLVIALVLVVQFQGHHRQHPRRPSALVAPPAPSPRSVFENVVGVSLVIVFILYVLGVVWAIGRGMLNPPEGSDSESDGDSDSSDSDTDSAPQRRRPGRSGDGDGDDDDDDQSDAVSTRTFASESDGASLPPPPPPPKSRLRSAQKGSRANTASAAAAETTPLLVGRATSNSLANRQRSRNRRSIHRAARKLVWALLVLSLSGYLLSRSTLDLARSLHISDTVLGLTLLSFATTLPEKLLSVVAGRKVASQQAQTMAPQQQRQQRPQRSQQPSPVRARGSTGSAVAAARSARWLDDDERRFDDEGTAASGILMAGAAGSNIFLLTLCLGVSLIFDRGAGGLPTLPIATAAPGPSPSSANSVRWEELALLEASSAALVAIAYAGGARWHGCILFAAYIAFLVAEFTVLKR